MGNWLIILMSATVWPILNVSEWNKQKRKLCDESFDTCFEKIVNSNPVNLFLAGISNLKPLWVVGRGKLQQPYAKSWNAKMGQSSQ